MRLKQIRMRACTLKSNGTRFEIGFINKNPITLNVDKRTFLIFVKRMIMAFRRQGLFVNDHVHDFDEFIEIHTVLHHQPVLFSEGLCIKG